MLPTATTPDVDRKKYRLPKLASDGLSVTVDLSAVPADRRSEVMHSITGVIAAAWAAADPEVVADCRAGAAEAEAGLLTPHEVVFARLRERRS